MSDVTPIRPEVQIKRSRKKSERRSSFRNGLLDLQYRVGRAAALSRAMAAALDGQLLDDGMEPADGCLGIAELLDDIRGKLYELAVNGPPAA